VSTTFHADNPNKFHYGRNDQPTRQRAELLIGKLEGGYAVLYSSGMATVWAALNHYNPKRVAIDRGYHITHKALVKWFRDGSEGRIITLDADFQKGDLIWVETPRNPTSELHDIEKFVKKSQAAGAILLVDSTFASPVLQQPLLMGADIVMHSCTKYLSGHDDVLSGVLITKDQKLYDDLMAERTILGSVPGSLECFLLLRSIRTLQLRVLRQSSTACKVVEYLSNHPNVSKAWHPSLPSSADFELCKRQMKAPPAVFSVEFITGEITQSLLKKVKIFTPATSLGGSMSLVDWRHARDATQPVNLLRFSTGLEDPADLIADLEQALSSQ